MASHPYIGSRVSLVSKTQMRYEGTLYTIDPTASTIALSNVKCFGTEDRCADKVTAASDAIYQFITFKGDDILSLIVCDQAAEPEPAAALPDDPAIVSSAVPPEPQQPPPQPQPHPQPPMAAEAAAAAGAASAAAVPSTDYDFQSANARFDKQSFQRDSAAAAIGDVSSDVVPPPLQAAAAAAQMQPAQLYDKKKSFFDDISCDRDQRRQQPSRGRNEETFGAIASSYDGPRRFGRDRRGRGGRGRSSRRRDQRQWRDGAAAASSSGGGGGDSRSWRRRPQADAQKQQEAPP